MSITPPAAGTDGLSDYRRGVGFLLARLGGMAERDWNVHLKNNGLTQLEFTVLAILLSPYALRQSDVAHRSGVDPRNVVTTVAGLLRRNLIEAEVASDDRRAKLLTLSAEGRRILSELDESLAPARETFCASLTDDEEATLRTLLTRLYEAHVESAGRP